MKQATSVRNGGAQEPETSRFVKLQQDDTHLPRNTHDPKPNESVNKCLNPLDVVNNHVRTAKYTRYSFLPLVLWEQFQKKANFYFLIIAILSWTPVTPRSPLTSTAPLVFVLTVSAIKEAWEDWQRHKQDRDMNEKLVWKFDKIQKRFVQEESQKLRVGDVIRVEQNEMFPADILLLQSKLNNGTTYIETANLDGETNLKVRQALKQTCTIACNMENGGEDYPPKISAVVQSDLPSAKMQENGWSGTLIGISVKDPPDDNKYNDRYPLGMNNLCLRGCQLRNTPWCIGMIMFTGVQTKIMMNSQKQVFKRSNVDRIVDKMLYFIFGFQAVICGIAVVMYYRWLSNNRDETWYLGWEFDDPVNWQMAALNFFTFLILIDILVPISLYVSMEVVKFAQAWLITQDMEMYHEETDTPAKARTSNLNEELGQVDYVFSDKTGTLTQNKMEFLRCFVANKEYGPGRMDLDDEKRKPKKLAPGIPQMPTAFEDTRVLHDLHEDKQRARTIDQFLTCMATCHTVMPNYENGEIEYQSSSPDEKALVEFATSQQYFLKVSQTSEAQVQHLRLDTTSLIVNIEGTEHKFHIYCVLKFTSSRKRMSVVVYDQRDNQYKMFCKGADNVIEERLSDASKQRDWPAADLALKGFANHGLRTLVCGYRVLDKDYFFNWLVKHNGILTRVENIQTRDEDAAKSMAELECELELIGCTAIEDKLQDGVPETIHKLHQGNMKCWMLTGDKVETAKNIGITCRLITAEMQDSLETFDPRHPEGTTLDQKQRGLKNRFDTITTKIKRRKREEGHRTEGGDFHQAIVVSGRAIELIFPAPVMDAQGHEVKTSEAQAKREDELQEVFFELCELCNAVVCCRISPKQKAQIVQMVRKYKPNDITLAIGDGANDVAMIKAAHVGIGISGLEGLQAVMASDYAIAQFRFLQNLLFVHGAWSYRRISVLILYSFYKNVCLTMSQVWFAFYNGWSGQIFYDAWAGSMYNVMFTSLPILFAAVLNRDYSYKTALDYPALYRDGQENRTFNIQLFIGYFFQGMLHSIAMFFVVMNGMPDITSDDGQVVDLWMISTTLYTACNMVVTAKICLLTTTWTTMGTIVVIGSISAWFGFLYVYCLVWQVTPAMYGVAQRLFPNKIYWMVVFICVCLCILPDIAIEYIKKEHWPSRVDLVRWHTQRRKARGKQDKSLLG